MLEKLFKLSKAGTNAKTEIIAGLTTFLTMSYIIVLAPDMLSIAGIDKGMGHSWEVAFITALIMPFTFSIAQGIALGFIAYALMKILTGKFEAMTVGVYVVSTLFILKFIFL